MTGTPPSPPPPPLLGSKPGDEQLLMTSINVECFGDEPLPLTLHLLTQQPMPIVISSTRALSRGLELELELPHHHPSSTRTDAHPSLHEPGLASPRAQPSIRGTGQVDFGIQSTAFVPVYFSGRVCPSRYLTRPILCRTAAHITAQTSDHHERLASPKPPLEDLGSFSGFEPVRSVAADPMGFHGNGQDPMRELPHTVRLSRNHPGT
ncbi:hypothetical protein B0J15DRAFT_457743 [Fusarium solani]|uniref:Uncharacterized protein n=1 Tax=Fusarium solani TaxID=169388 RepID=A0A9P9L7F2_FUSSL|nr:uncharacterized protein B0J15DRAFT_457743 [Fusarium solani]KAH7275581.1 hypothetical protein B0J15DRAFT_457743 [Fusarium solani]